MCQAWDLDLQPICADEEGMPLNDAPDWCGDSWCYVNAQTCTKGLQATSYFPDEGLMYSYEVCMNPEANSEVTADSETDEANSEQEEMEMLGPDEICCGVFRTNYYWWNDFLEKYICPEVERRKNPNPEPICDATQLDDETMAIATEAIAT